METASAAARRVLVTGAAGYIGRQLVRRLATDPAVEIIVASDLRPSTSDDGGKMVVDVRDIRDPALAEVMLSYRIDSVIHLASVVTPPPGMPRQEIYSIDVGGTQNVLEGCSRAGVRRLIVSSSGAAYGYHADNPDWIDETAPLRGNESFAYSHHKRIIEELLARYRDQHPELVQIVFRFCTILGREVNNQISALFEGKVVLGVSGSLAPFVFIWDEDVVEVLRLALWREQSGIYNVAGDGALTLPEIARKVGKPYVPLPRWLLIGALAVLHRLGLSRYGPEQVDFLAFRPVLSNRRLKEEFGYVPRYSSTEAFERYWATRQSRGT
ncbi:MAG: SDR family oxidoreductase [Candidatus Binatia bacterium]|nr:SDR family oxidoreductase [Candidatus Binatia bacterium]